MARNLKKKVWSWKLERVVQVNWDPATLGPAATLPYYWEAGRALDGFSAGKKCGETAFGKIILDAGSERKRAS